MYKLRFYWMVLTVLVCALSALPAAANSQARIVRLSDVHGGVQIEKNAGLGFENAFLNLPITQGTQVRTRSNGRAEIEFEDGSTLRLTPNTSIDFSTLGLSDAGKHISAINLVEGMAYVNWLGKGGDEFSLTFSRETIALDHAAHFRVQASSETANVAVFKGDVGVEGPSGKIDVARKTTATFDSAEDDKYTVANNVADAALDSWDKESVAYHDQYSKNNSTPYGYGVSDLNYYGSYSNVPGYGMMWQPFFTGVGWDPFMDGAWSWYPGYGYMFASAYPWGWLPYRYGNWNFIPGMGWMWQPGAFNSWQTMPHYTPTTLTHVTLLVAPTAGAGKTVIVGRGVVASPSMPSHVIVRSGSAGMGIARGSLENLSHLNRQVAKSGFTEVHPAPQFSSSSPSRMSGMSSARSSMASPSMGRASSSSSHSSGGTSHH